MLAHAEIAAPPVLRAMAERGIGLIVAVLPGPRGDLVRLARLAAEAGVKLAYWPMIADAAGRWASVANAAPFASYVRELVRELEREGVFPSEMAIDLEPPLDRVRATLALEMPPLVDPRAEEGAAILGALARDLRARGISISAAVMPFLLFDGDSSPFGIERALGTPVSDVEWDHASVMMYSSLVTGYSRGLLRRSDVRPLLAAACRAAARRFGAAAGISIGAVGKGALGDEATYRSTFELADDVAIARASGIDDLTLFDLGGVLRRPPMEAWLDAFVETAPASKSPPWTLRSRAVAATGLAVSRLVKVLNR